jgi:hypothetical protein
MKDLIPFFEEEEEEERRLDTYSKVSAHLSSFSLCFW